MIWPNPLYQVLKENPSSSTFLPLKRNSQLVSDFPLSSFSFCKGTFPRGLDSLTLFPDSVIMNSNFRKSIRSTTAVPEGALQTIMRPGVKLVQGSGVTVPKGLLRRRTVESDCEDGPPEDSIASDSFKDLMMKFYDTERN